MVEDFDEFDDFDDDFDDDFEDIDDFEDYDDFEDFDDETLDFDNLDFESKEELDIFDEKPLELDSDYDINAVEVHISDLSQREDFRKISYIRNACIATIAGHGTDGYIEAKYSNNILITICNFKIL